MSLRWSLLLAALSGAAWLSTAHAQDAVLVRHAAEGALRIDGSLRDWGDVDFLSVGHGDDASMRIAFAQDARNVYVAAEVRDDRLIRAAGPTAEEDAVIVTFASGRGASLSAKRVWLWAGDAHAGRRARSGISQGGGPPRLLENVSVVEAPIRGGYTLEAAIPVSVLGANWEEGRLGASLRDVDQAAHPEVESEPSLGRFDPADLAQLLRVRTEQGGAAALEAFTRAHRLEGRSCRFAVRGDVGEDARPERICVLDRFVVVSGEGWQGGSGHSFLELPVREDDALSEPNLVDLTGDGKSELLLTMRQVAGQERRTFRVVIGWRADALRTLGSFVIGVETDRGNVRNSVRVNRSPRGSTVEVQVDVPRAASSPFDIAESEGAEPILLPWGEISARVYRWNGTRFEVASQRRNPRFVPPSEAPALAREPANAGAPRESRPTSAPSLDGLIASFRQERGIPASRRPSWEARVNVAGDPTPETVLAFGRDLLVVGERFLEGSRYFHFQLPASSDDDVLEIRAADLTGDPRAELLFRIRQTLGRVRREVLLVHQFTPTGFPPLLARELAREEGHRRIDTEVRTDGNTLELRARDARNWDAQSWPYSDAPSGDGIELPLLPWRDSAVRYRHREGRLVPR